jgi:2-dehydro-3-deoxygluconokinase
VGDDPFGASLRRAWQAEGIDVSHAPLAPGFNGIYFISLLPDGEREFTYYRAGSAASSLSPDDIDADYVAGARIVHASGISQAISSTCRAAVKRLFEVAKAAGVRVSYDPNFRAKLWARYCHPERSEGSPPIEGDSSHRCAMLRMTASSSPADLARAAADEVLPLVDILLPSAPEETGALWGLDSPQAVAEHFRDRGVGIVAVKCGTRGAFVAADGIEGVAHVPAFTPDAPIVDTTGAGDAFNGAFLHGLCAGMSAADAARLGVITAILKSRGRGAVASLPRAEEVRAAFAR